MNMSTNAQTWLGVIDDDRVCVGAIVFDGERAGFCEHEHEWSSSPEL